MPSPSAALILAAGQGQRMQSDLPKVLHPCAGLPMVCHVVRRALHLGCDPIVLVVSPTTHGPVERTLSAYFQGAPVVYAVQKVPEGTGDAARVGLTVVPEHIEQVFILYGDVPLLQDSTLAALRAAAIASPLAVLTAHVADATGYGRLIRDLDGRVAAVVEHKDATEAQRAVREINAGVYCVKASLLREGLASLTRHNAQNELYLTDIVALAASRGGAMAHAVAYADEVRGVNSRAELGLVEGILRRRLIAEHQARGVSFIDPGNVVLGVDVQLGRDVVIGPGVQLLGQTALAADVRIDGPSVLIDTVVEGGAHVRSFCHLEKATVGAKSVVGPYARLRPEAHLRSGAHVGNFVEIKNATLDSGAKVNHLSYVGDAHIGAAANLGAGTITCNYDGYQKHQTKIGAGAFIGSNSSLVAPVCIGEDATVAAGSVVVDDVPKDALAFGRAKQVNKAGLARVLRDRLAAKKRQAAQSAQTQDNHVKKEGL